MRKRPGGMVSSSIFAKFLISMRPASRANDRGMAIEYERSPRSRPSFSNRRSNIPDVLHSASIESPVSIPVTSLDRDSRFSGAGHETICRLNDRSPRVSPSIRSGLIVDAKSGHASWYYTCNYSVINAE